MKFRKQNSGFSLIEVMISLVILAVGILGISKLQATLIQTSSDANQRVTAVSLAQQKIDDLRSFPNLTVGTASDSIPDTWTTGIADANLAFAHIDDDAGGTMAATTYSIGNYVFNLNWDVTDYYYTGSPSVATTPVVGDADFKRVEVTVAWTDESGGAQSIVLDTVIDAYAPEVTALSGTTTASVAAGPRVIHNKGDELSSGESSNPNESQSEDVGIVVHNSGTNIVASHSTSFFHLSGTDYILDTQDEFVTVSCNCQFQVSTGSGATPAHVVWDEDDNRRVNKAGTFITKETAFQTGNDAEVTELCTQCCRDHHDDSASPVKYVYGTTTGNHAHYQADGTTLAIRANGDTYTESCRFKRVDGIFRVFQDWKLYDAFVATDASLKPAQTVADAYGTYVADYVLSQVNGTTAPTKPTTDSDIVTTVGAGLQVQTRGIYIDQVYDDSGAVDPTAYTSYVGDSSNADRLRKIPFSETNLTLLASWTSADSNFATVSDEALFQYNPSGGYYGTNSNGYVVGVAETTTDVVVTGTMVTNNNGFTEVANATNVTISDGVNVEVDPASTTTITVTGSFDIDFSHTGATNNATITISPSATCTTGVNSVDPSNPFSTYTCSISTPSNDSIVITAAVTGGQPAKRCSGSTSFSLVGLTSDTPHNFTGNGSGGEIECL